jgi:predicted MFS family arabinose efflux permease
VFGLAAAAGIGIAGIMADRLMPSAMLAALVLLAAAAAGLAVDARCHAVLLGAAALWGAAFGGAPALLQTALIDASGPASADVATSMQTTVYNVGIAAGSVVGGLILDRAGPGALPWVTSLLAAAAAVTVAAGRRHAFPASRRPPSHPPRPAWPRSGRTERGSPDSRTLTRRSACPS